MTSTVIVAFSIGLLILCILSRVFTLPIRLLWKAIYNSIIGAVILYFVNILGFIHIDITFFKALFAGIFGIPGVIIIIILHLL